MAVAIYTKGDDAYDCAKLIWKSVSGWKKDNKGWWYAKNRSYVIDGKEYTFDANGYMEV